METADTPSNTTHQLAFDGFLDQYDQRTPRGNYGGDVLEDDMEEMRDHFSDMENKLDSMEGMMTMMEKSIVVKI